MKNVFAFIALLPSVLFGQHTISGVFSPAEDYKVLILYKVTPSESIYVANSEVNDDGGFEIHLDASITAGMYRLVYALPQEDYNFDIIYNGQEDIVLTFNSDTQAVFQKSVENKLWASYIKSMAMINQSINKFYTENGKNKEALASIFKTQRETQANFEAAAKGTIALNFIKANRTYVPDYPEDIKTYVGNLQKHFFDYIDFNNDVLQSSKFLEERMFNYVFGISHSGLDVEAGYKKNVDAFYETMTSASTEIKRYLLVDLWEKLVDSDLESVAKYIAETYLMAIAQDLNDTSLVEGLTKFISTSIGSKAPDFPIEVDEQDKKAIKKMHQLLGYENYVIVFWSTSCPHCLEEVPQLNTFIKDQKPDKIKVVAVGLEDEPTAWSTMISKFPHFIHVYGEGKWDNSMANSYNVHETPMFFVLNQDKIIISKPDDVEALRAFFEN